MEDEQRDTIRLNNERVFIARYEIDQKSGNVGLMKLELTFVSKDRTPEKYKVFLDELHELLLDRRGKLPKP